MEKKLFKTALEFIEKYDIVSSAITIYAHPHCIGSKIRMHCHAFENYKVMMELNVTNCEEDGWYTVTENGIDLTLTYD